MDQNNGLTTENLTLHEAFTAFCEVYMPSRNLSHVTRRGYTYDLSEWLAQVQVTSVKDISSQAIQRYLSLLDQKGLKGSTRHRKVAAIKTFLKYLEGQGSLPSDFSKKLI